MALDDIKAVDDFRATLHRTPGGGTRSEKAAPFHLVPPDGFARIALRFGLGAEKHGDWNWMLSVQTEQTARVWCEEAYNHMLTHAQKMAAGEDPDDDHVGAIGWAVCIFAYVERKYGKRWTELDLIRGDRKAPK